MTFEVRFEQHGAANHRDSGLGGGGHTQHLVTWPLLEMVDYQKRLFYGQTLRFL